MHDEDVKLEDSIQYDAYKELVNYSKYFDISKKHTVFGDIYWGDVEFDEFKENIKERYIFLANNSLFLLAPLLLREGDFSTTLDNGAVLVQHNFSGNIYLKNDIYLSVLLEQYLFIDDYKKSILYKKINEYKEDYYYLENYKQGLLLLEGRILKETEYYCLHNKKFYPVDISDGLKIVKLSEKKKENMTIIKGCEIYDNEKELYLVKENDLSAHGETLREAIEDITYKKMKSEEVQNIVKEIKKTGKVNKAQYRAITGACQYGTNKFCEEHRITVEEIELEELRKILINDYGAEKFWSLIDKE